MYSDGGVPTFRYSGCITRCTGGSPRAMRLEQLVRPALLYGTRPEGSAAGGWRTQPAGPQCVPSLVVHMHDMQMLYMNVHTSSPHPSPYVDLGVFGAQCVEVIVKLAFTIATQLGD